MIKYKIENKKKNKINLKLIVDYLRLNKTKLLENFSRKYFIVVIIINNNKQ